MSDFVFELEMKLKDSECENNTTVNLNRNAMSSSSLNRDNNNNNSNTMLNNSYYDLDRNASVDEGIKKIQRNYVEYYSKNLNDLEKYKFYNEILNSITFENKEPEIKDLIQIDRLFSVNSDDNPNLNITNLNDSVNSISILFYFFKL